MANTSYTTTTAAAISEPISKSMCDNKLVEIPFCDLTKLCQLYMNSCNCITNSGNSNDVNYCCNCWPENHIGYIAIRNYLNWLYDDDDNNNANHFKCIQLTAVPLNGKRNRLKNVANIAKKIKIYSLNGDWQTDGFFIIIDSHQLIFNILYGFDPDKVRIALNLLSFESPISILNGFPTRLIKPVKEFMLERQLDINNPMNLTTLWYFLAANDAAKFELNLPENIFFKPLNLDHAIEINYLWSWKHKGSFELIRKLIICNKNVGAFDNNGILIGWCLRQQIGALGILYVKESYRKRGIGRLMVMHMSKILADCNCDTFSTVAERNHASRGLFESLGFTVVNEMNWIVIERNKK